MKDKNKAAVQNRETVVILHTSKGTGDGVWPPSVAA